MSEDTRVLTSPRAWASSSWLLDGASGERLTVARRVAGRLALAGLVGSSAALAAGAAHRAHIFIPSRVRPLPAWLAGPLAGLHLPRTEHGAAGLLVVMFACYLMALACARELPARWAIGAIVVAHVAFLLGPPLFSADVLSYIDFARLGAIHGLNPYSHGADAAPGDAVFPFIRWHHVATPYGSVFTLASYALALVSVPVALWALKVTAAAASLGCVALVWRIARQRGNNPVPAILFLGANPLVLAHAVGGGHNDPLLMLVVLIGISWALAGRAAASGAAIVVAVGIKISSGLVAPFMLLGSGDRRAFLKAAVATGLALLAVTAIVFGADGLGLAAQISQQQHLANSHSIPTELSNLVGIQRTPGWMRLVMGAAFATVVGISLWRTWRGADWIVGAGWATLAALVTTAWLTPWYALWVLPLAAVADNRRLRIGVLLLCAYIIGARVIPILAYGEHAGLT